LVICRGEPPVSGMIQICCGFLLAATSTVCTLNATQRPSGESCGSPTRLSSSSALTSNGRFCAASIAAKANSRSRLRRTIPEL
jgi:hypothetical protein